MEPVENNKGDSNSEDTFKIVETTHKRLVDARYKDGYRDGITDGQEVSLQKGFNKGYTLGYTTVNKVARLRGVLWSLAVTHHNSVLSEEITKMFEESENRLKLAATSCDTSIPSNVESIRQLESQVIESFQEYFLNECKKLNLMDEKFAMQLFLSAIE